MDHPTFSHVTTPEAIAFAGVRCDIKLSWEQTGGAFCLCDITAPPGNATPPHVHSREDETMYLLEGALEATVGDQTVSVKPGETIFLPRDVPHQVRNAGAGDARYVLVCNPAGFERFVRASGNTDFNAAPVPVERLIAIAAEYGIAIPPPPRP
jgi:mannose-6-phosphate isomerase-like protein (cupin superfamily)